MDISKAFDTLNHDILITKLHAYGSSKESLKLIFGYLYDKFQRTKICGSFLTWAVPQGSVLGPLLFNTYLNDMKLKEDKCHLLGHRYETLWDKIEEARIKQD